MGAPAISRRQFNERLLSSLTVPPAEQSQLIELALTGGAAFPRFLVARGLVTPERLRGAYQEMCGISAFRNDPEAERPAAGDTLPLSFLRARLLFPLSLDDGTLTVAMADPLDSDSSLTGCLASS